MSKTNAIMGCVLFFVAAPMVVAGLVPWWITRWSFTPEARPLAGLALVAFGLIGLVDAFARFALQGRGTPAAVAPTEKLVVSGPYRHVRNPMYLFVLATIWGQAVLFGNWLLVLYGALCWLAFHTSVVLYEEPTLKRAFGAAYDTYRSSVQRWIPRSTPWRWE